ncbi:hypothetical protein D3C73_1009710 [compost metagenome]
MGVEVRMRVQPQHPQLLAGFAAMARHGADGTDAQAVVTAQQDGQAALAEFGVDGVMHGLVPRGHFRQMAIAVVRRPPRVGGAVEVATVYHFKPLRFDHGAQVRHAQGFRAHRRAASARADIRGRADQGNLGRQGNRVLHAAGSGGVHHWADSTLAVCLRAGSICLRMWLVDVAAICGSRISPHAAIAIAQQWLLPSTRPSCCTIAAARRSPPPFALIAYRLRAPAFIPFGWLSCTCIRCFPH